MRDLFRAPATDLAYANVRDPKHEGAARARANCDDLWRDFESHASEHFLAEFPYRFHQRWFEMYLAVALLRSGLKIHCPDADAPDVRVDLSDGKSLWLEAIAPTGGDESNPDRVVQPQIPRGEPAVAYQVPTEQVILRVRGALDVKARKLKTYRDRGIIAADEQALIAISVRDIPHGFFDAEKYGLGAVYGLGDPYVTIDRDNLQVVERGHQHRAEVTRGSGASVGVAPFLHAGHEHVTGALISALDAANCEPPLGRDFMLLPNPNASPQYSEGQISLGREWRLRPVGEPGAYQMEVIEYR